MLDDKSRGYQKAHRELIDKYWQDTESVSQSTLKSEILRVKGVKSDQEQDNQEKNPVQMGSLLDCMLFTPSLVPKLYHVGISSKKSDGKVATAIRNVVKQYCIPIILQDENRGPQEDSLLPLNIADFETEFVKALDEVQYYMNRDTESRMNDVYKAEDYFVDLCNQANKRLISQEEYKSASLSKTAIQMSDIWTDIFTLAEKDDDIEVFTQQPVHAYINGVLCKGLLDLVVVNHRTKTVVYHDLKRTTRTQYAFEMHARQLRYDFQLSFYGRLLHEASFLDTPLDRVNIEGYSVWCGGLITCFVASNGETESIKLFEIDNEDLKIGRYGRSWKRVYTVKDVPVTKEFVDMGYEEALQKYAAGNRRDNQPFKIWN